MKTSLQKQRSSVQAAGASASGGSGGGLNVDIQRLVYDVNTAFNPLHHDALFDCRAVDDREGQVLLIWFFWRTLPV